MEYEKEDESLLKKLDIENLIEIERRLGKDLSKLDIAKQLTEGVLLGSATVCTMMTFIYSLSFIKFFPEATIASIILILTTYATAKVKVRSWLSRSNILKRSNFIDRIGNWSSVVKRTKVAYGEKAVGVDAGVKHLESPENQLELLTILNQHRASINAIPLISYDYHVQSLCYNLEKKQYPEAMQDIVTLFLIVQEHCQPKQSDNYYNKLKNMVYSQKKPTYKERL